MDTLLSGQRDSIQTEIVGKMQGVSFAHLSKPSQNTVTAQKTSFGGSKDHQSYRPLSNPSYRLDSANATSTISTAPKDVSHHVHTASFQELESGQKAAHLDQSNFLNIEECKPAEQSVSFDEVKQR